MLDWLDEVAGPGYTQAIVVTLLALVGLILLLFVIRLVRSTFSGTFVAGGRNRKTRLAVMDATAVDSHRRLILVRRDDIEHLLLIGGTTDIVVERDIRIGQQRRPAAPAEPVREPQAPQPAAVLPPAPAAPARRPPEPLRAAPPAPPQPAPSLSPNRIPAQAAPRPPEMLPQRTLARPELTRPAAPVTPPRAEPRPAPILPPAPTLRGSPAPSASDNDLDDALLKELEVSLDDSETRNGETRGGKPAPSLDEEMAKLLGELSNPRR